MSDHERLLARIERIYAAVGATKGNEFNPTIEEEEDNPGVFHINLFGKESDAHTANLAHTAVYAVGTFYEHCKHFAKRSGIALSLVEQVIQNSLELRIVYDLYTADKHAVARSSSGMNPTLREIRRWARLRPSNSIAIGFGEDGRPIVNIDQRISTIVDGEVINSKNEESLGRLENILSSAVFAWEEFLQAQGIIQRC